MTARPRRSALYLPASNPRAIEKARGLPCDVVILDLEDAVAPKAKADARAAAVAAVAQGGFGRRELVVRINALDSEWGGDDLAALAAARPDAILVPKVADAGDVARPVAEAGGVPIWAMIETPGAVLRLDAIAAVEGLDALVLGTNDLAKDLRLRGDSPREVLAPLLIATIAAARAHGRMVLDGVWNALDDDAGLARECEQGVAFGFDGKTLVHPGQIATCNAAFSPTPDELAWARTVAAAFAAPEATGKGAIRLEGRMVERLHLAQAQDILAVQAALDGDDE